MYIGFSPEAAAKLKEIIGENTSRVIVSGENCNSCFGGGIKLIVSKRIRAISEFEFGISNNLKWGCLKSETSILDGTEVDYKVDKVGEYFEIFSRGHYVPLAIDQLVISPVY